MANLRSMAALMTGLCVAALAMCLHSGCAEPDYRGLSAAALVSRSRGPQILLQVGSEVKGVTVIDPLKRAFRDGEKLAALLLVNNCQGKRLTLDLLDTDLNNVQQTIIDGYIPQKYARKVWTWAYRDTVECKDDPRNITLRLRVGLIEQEVRVRLEPKSPFMPPVGDRAVPAL